jgi:hypothetical protein
MSVGLRWGCIVLVAAGGGAARAADTPLLRVLMVLDTSDPDLAPGVGRDRRNVERFLATQLPESRYTVDVLEGQDLTAGRVLNYYKDLPVAPSDALFFYYSGHGSIRPDQGHTLELKAGRSPLVRSALKKAMTEKKPRLTVLLTDCCSDSFRVTVAEARDAIPLARPTAPTPLANRLFFDARGVIDLTAADKDVAYADDYHGGYFTHSVCAVASRNKAQTLDWKEFAAAVQKETGAVHKRAIDEGIAPKLRSGERLQQPTAMEPLPAAIAAFGQAVTAVIGLTNPTERPVEIEYRWSDTQPWTKLTIPAGSKRALGARVPGERVDTPALKVRINDQEQALPAKVWDKEGTPKFSDGKVYRFAPKPVGKTAAPRSLSVSADPVPAAPESDDPPADVLPLTPTPTDPRPSR